MVLVINHFQQESVKAIFLFVWCDWCAHLFQLIRMFGDRVQFQHFRFLSAQLADVAAHLRAVLCKVSDK
jgi:hypothetical protein